MTNKISSVVFVIVCALHACASFAIENDYNTNRIPESLKKHANAVIRNFHEEINIKGPGEIYVTTRIAITILNEKGKEYGIAHDWYNQFIKIKSIDGWLYDKDGNEIDKLKQRALKDIGVIGVAFMDDIRIKTAEFDYSVYPYTCVYEVEKRLDYSFNIPEWSPKEHYDCAVEHADIEVLYPKDFPLRYKTFHITKQPELTTEDNRNKLSLYLNDIAAGTKPDEFTPLENHYFPTLIFAADKFEFDGREGSMATWSDLGKFVYQLNENRDELPPEIVAVVHTLTDTCRSDASKISVLYEYLKKNTRYVSIQLGIGGYQAFDAKFVAKKGYGDCKALSNYMKSLLKAAGINSYMTLVYGGQKDDHMMIPDFPCSVFNHAILCVPGQKDPTWVECTAKDLPAGYLSSYTANRDVLLLTPDGGVEVRTPDYNLKTNRAVRTADMYINAKDEMQGTIALTYTGYLWDAERTNVLNVPKSKIDNYLNGKFSIPTYSIGNYNVANDLSGHIPAIHESIAISGSGNISRSGKNLFLSTAILPLHIPQPDTYEARKKPFYIAHSYIVTDTVRFHLSGRYTMQAPYEKKLDLPFSNYWYNAELESDTVLKVTMTYTQQEGEYAPELYAGYIKLTKQINAVATSDKIILTAKE